MKIKRDEAYNILELTEGATEEEIKRQFKRLALKWFVQQFLSHVADRLGSQRTLCCNC